MCPFRQCDKKFTVKSTFTSHVSRQHKDYSEGILVESIASTSSTSDRYDESCDTQLESPSQSSDEDMEVYSERADEGEFVRHLALFYLKLQAKLLLPSSTIQTIIEHYQEIHDINQSHLLSKLNEKLTSLGLSEADINTVIDTLRNEDLHRASNTHTLKTDHKRKTFFKSNFNYVEPLSIYFGQNESGKECFGQYVPVKNTIQSLLSSESVMEQLQQAKTRVQPDNVLQDVWDGTIIEKNLLLNHMAPSLGVILYQDSFEVVNPLGSGRKKHKILAVYLTLANILPYNRSSIDHMQLVLLCREQDYKYFGQDLVFGPFMKDLKELELNGITEPCVS